MAAKTRISVTFDEKTLRLANREARRRKTSLSEFVRTAIRSAAEQVQEKAEAAALREQRQKAIEGIRRIAHKLGDWPVEQTLRDMRCRPVRRRDGPVQK